MVAFFMIYVYCRMTKLAVPEKALNIREKPAPRNARPAAYHKPFI
jgi:hypothetical protein